MASRIGSSGADVAAPLFQDGARLRTLEQADQRIPDDRGFQARRPVQGYDFGDDPVLVADEDGSDLARQRGRCRSSDMARRVNEVLGPVIDEGPDCVHDFELVGEELGR